MTCGNGAVPRVCGWCGGKGWKFLTLRRLVAGRDASELLARGATGRERSEGRLFSRLINGDRGGFLGYATWRKYLALAHGFTAAHKDGAITYTAHELRHVCASLMIASGATGHAGRQPDGAQQGRDDQEHLRH